MKIKHQEIEIPVDKPFSNCKLAREPFARVLSDIVDTYADGFVLAINNEWGTGKTTFVKMWQQQLEMDGFETIYFNAWENDFNANPLVAIMSELETLTNAKTKKIFKSVLEKGAILVKTAVPALLKATASKFIDAEVLVDAIENTAKGSTEILEEIIKEYASKKNTLLEFRNELENFLKQNNNTKPLIFIIDELDRCRPNYAVEVLEQIKHFFLVSGIVFVLSIDKKHLGSAVKGFYGSEQIDSEEYLRRFIDLEFSIPTPDRKLFIEYLYDYFHFADFFTSNDRKMYPEFQSDAQSLLKIAELLFTKANATLRQQERIFGVTRLILCSFRDNQYTFSHLLFILIFLKSFQNETFRKIEKHELSLQELSNTYYNTINSNIINQVELNLLYIEALLLLFYQNGLPNHMKIEHSPNNGTDNSFLTIKSKTESEIAGGSLTELFARIPFQIKKFELSYLIDKINLTISMKS